MLEPFLEKIRFEHPQKADTCRVLFESDHSVIETTTKSGKTRQKKIKGFDLAGKALSEILRRGFLARQDGLLILSTELGPPLGMAFAVDEERDVAWLGDWGALRRVCLQTGAVESLPTGPYCGIQAVQIDEDGNPWLLASRAESEEQSDWLSPTENLEYAVLRGDGGELCVRKTVEISSEAFKTTGNFLGLSKDGVLLPCEGGALVLSREDDSLIAEIDTPAMKHWSPKAAVSPNGRFLVATKGQNKVERRDLLEGKTLTFEGEFDDVMDLTIDDDGQVGLGSATPNWSYQRFSENRKILINERCAEYAYADDLVYCTDGIRGRVFDLDGVETSTFPVFGGAKGSPIWVGKKGIYSRTRLGVFQRFPLPTDSPPQP